MALSAALASGSNLLLRYAMDALSSRSDDGPLLLAAVADPLVLTGLFGYGLSHLLWLNVLSRARLGAMFPIFVSTTFILVMAGSVLALGEHLTWQRLSGATLVATGMMIAEWRRSSRGAEADEP